MPSGGVEGEEISGRRMDSGAEAAAMFGKTTHSQPEFANGLGLAVIGFPRDQSNSNRGTPEDGRRRCGM